MTDHPWHILMQAHRFVQADRAALEGLDPATRVRVMAALAGLIILGFGLVALAWLGARLTRRYMNRGSGRQRSISVDDWAHKPLPPQDRHR